MFLARSILAGPPRRFIGRIGIPRSIGWLPLLLVALCAQPHPAAAGTESTFTNPIVERGADPWVIQHGEDYLYCFSRRGRIHVSSTNRLEHIGDAEPVSVWQPPAGEPYSRNLWAPELFHLEGRFYIYVAADDGENANHRMWVLEGDAVDPQKPFQLKGKITSDDDHWAIDGTVLTLPDGQLYFIWSGWEGHENVQQNLYIAPMSNPWTVSGPRMLISEPTHDWERHGRPLINEGPQALWNDGQLFVIYSASGSWTDDYCLGQLRWTGEDPLSPDSWIKHPEPVFSRTEEVFGPGHASFVKSPDGTEDWIVYHAARQEGSGWDRNIRMQPFTWNADGSPDFGEPVPPGHPLKVPSHSNERGERNDRPQSP